MLFQEKKSILVDVGGSGVKLAEYSKGSILQQSHYSVDSYEKLVRIIKDKCNGEKLGTLAMSIAGFVNSDEGKVIMSRNASYLEGNLVRKLQRDFPGAKVNIVNDGEAHARSLLYHHNNVKFGAIHFAFGTSVAFGVINEKKNSQSL